MKNIKTTSKTKKDVTTITLVGKRLWLGKDFVLNWLFYNKFISYNEKSEPVVAFMGEYLGFVKTVRNQVRLTRECIKELIASLVRTGIFKRGQFKINDFFD